MGKQILILYNWTLVTLLKISKESIKYRFIKVLYLKQLRQIGR